MSAHRSRIMSGGLGRERSGQELYVSEGGNKMGVWQCRLRTGTFNRVAREVTRSQSK